MAQMSLKQAREALGWTQTRLAREAGTSISAVHELERGDIKNPGYRVVMKVVAALKRGGLAGLKVEDVFPVDTTTPASSTPA